jgi:excisionase family DNA binding protein
MAGRSDPTDGDPMMTTEEVGEALRVNAKTVSRWAESGYIPAIQTPGGGKWLIRSSVVRRLLKGGES